MPFDGCWDYSKCSHPPSVPLLRILIENLLLQLLMCSKCHGAVVGIIQNVSTYLEFHFSGEFEGLQGKEAEC